MTWKSKTILITGSSHFIAAHLAEQLVRLGGNVKAFIRYDYESSRGSLEKLPAYIRSEIEVISGSLTNPEAVDYVSNSVDVVFHFGVLDMFPSDTNAREYIRKTVMGTFNVLNAARKYNVGKLVHISTAEVYGRTENIPISEEHHLRAQSIHISGDISAEKLVEGYFLSYGLPVTIARLFNTYGPIQSRQAIIPIIIAQAMSMSELLLGNMHAVRDFVYVKDVVQGLIKMAEIPETVGEAINLGSGDGISIEDLADRILVLISKDVEVLFDGTRIRLQDSRIRQLVADITKANDLLGWQPETLLDDGLRETIEWFSKYNGPNKG